MKKKMCFSGFGLNFNSYILITDLILSCFFSFFNQDDNKMWRILKDMGIADHRTCLLRNLYAGRKAVVRTGTMDCFKLGKEYIKAIYCHLEYLTYMQRTEHHVKWLGE